MMHDNNISITAKNLINYWSWHKLSLITVCSLFSNTYRCRGMICRIHVTIPVKKSSNKILRYLVYKNPINENVAVLSCVFISYHISFLAAFMRILYRFSFKGWKVIFKNRSLVSWWNSLPKYTVKKFMNWQIVFRLLYFVMSRVGDMTIFLFNSHTLWV